MKRTGKFLNAPFDDEEKRLMSAVENGESRAASKREVLKIKKMLNAAPSKVISLRMNESDLSELKEKAAAAGLPYQTLINSVLHRYVTGDVVMKSVV